MIEHESIYFQLIIIPYDVFSQEMFQTNFFAVDNVIFGYVWNLIKVAACPQLLVHIALDTPFSDMKKMLASKWRTYPNRIGKFKNFWRIRAQKILPSNTSSWKFCNLSKISQQIILMCSLTNGLYFRIFVLKLGPFGR